MSAITAEMEMELEDELAHAGASESEMEIGQPPAPEGEYEAEMEQEAFFNHLAAMADRGGRYQSLRRIGLAAARQALRSYRKTPPAIEGESEYEDEDEAFFELEATANPLQARHASAMMEHLGHDASAAESEEEAAEQFLPLIPLAAKLALPLARKLGARVLPALARKVTPHLTRGVAQVARTLFRSKATRPLLRAMPGIAKKTMASLAHQTARGHHVTPRTALRTLARHTARTLGSPHHAVKAFRRSKALDRRYHLAARRFIGRPVRRLPGQQHWNLRRRVIGHAGHLRHGYGRRPGIYRTGTAIASAPHYAGPRTTFYTGRRVAAPVHAAAGHSHAGQCQCFQPVSCASCAGPCPNCHR